MAALKTLPNDASAESFIYALPDEAKKADSLVLLGMYARITGEKPKMWGSSIIGYGMYHYKSDRSRQQGDWPLVGFSPRKQNLSLYFMLGFDKYTELLTTLGRHTTSKGCLYINTLTNVDQTVLEELIRRSYIDMKQMHGQA